MADGLYSTASSPLLEPHGHALVYSSHSSNDSLKSSGTVQHHRLQSLSGSSLSSLSSLWAPPFRRQSQNTSLISSSSHNLTVRPFVTPSGRRSISGSNSQRASFVSMLSSPFRSEPTGGTEDVEERPKRVDGSGELVSQDGHYELPSDELPLELQETPPIVSPSGSPVIRAEELAINEEERETISGSPSGLGMRRWLSTLRRRKQQSRSKSSPQAHRRIPAGSRSASTSPGNPPLPRHRTTHSQGSSLAFVSAVKSASATIASVSIATVSRRNTRRRQGHQRSSLISGSDPRPSVDSQRSMIDEAARQRSRKRREKVEELIRTEESYVADIKALSNVC